MKCPKCKKQLRKNAKYCPACGALVVKKNKRRFVLLLLGVIIFIGILLITAFGINNNKAIKSLNKADQEVIRNDIDVFSNGDITEITEKVFGITVDGMASSNSDNGIIADLFANAEITVSATEENSITYTIISPDISDFFQANKDLLQTVTTTDELKEALIDYAKAASTKTYTVTLPYTISDESGIVVEYNNPEFINAMTGGLLDAYADLYNQYLEEVG